MTKSAFIAALFYLLFAPCVYAGKSATTQDVFVHLFEWKWTDIALECENFLGPKGFHAVQISPPNEHAIVAGRPWYERYQPVSYKLISRSGNREEFADMVKRCKAAGVSIYADTVINHMAWVNRSGMVKYGIAGSPFNEYDHPGTFAPWDFNRCGRYGDDNIRNYMDRWEVQNCNLSNCADLNTGNEYVRGKLAEYLNDLLNLGAAGFRIDAAKHMAVADITNILSRTTSGKPYIFQEVIDYGGDEPIKSSEYFPNGDVVEFRYSRSLAQIFYNGKLNWLKNFGEDWSFVPSNKAIVFVDNHDIQRGHGGGGAVITHKDPRTYIMANVFMLAWPYGYPQVMSSFSFQNSEQGPPANAHGETKNVWIDGTPRCGEEWQCEHRWEPIANMVNFRRETSSVFRITDWWSNGENQIAFGRGPKGFVVINNEGTVLQATFQTSLPSGNYCDIVSGSIIKNTCTSRTINVDNLGRFNISVAPYSAAAIHVGASLSRDAHRISH